MNKKEAADLSVRIIMRYYENDYMAFLEQFDDNALWYGPLKGQFLQGREAMIRAWKLEEHSLTFSVGNVRTVAVSSHPSFCDVMTTYCVVTHYPNGEDISVDQQVLLTWCERAVVQADGKKRKMPRILVCHVSNPNERDEADKIYPVHYGAVYAGRNVSPQKGERLHFTGADRAEYFLLSDTIIWIESTDEKHSILHTDSEEIEVLPALTEIADKAGRLFLRCHQSYLVNPNYIKSIRRFKLELANGTVLPIPEKKYTAVKRAVLEAAG